MTESVNFGITRILNADYNEQADMKQAVDEAVARFLAMDWGDVPQEDKEANNEDLKQRAGHVLAKYQTPNGPIYINLEFAPPEEMWALIMYCNEY